MSSNPRRIARLWGSYTKVLPDDASYIQRKETRRAFYAGAIALFSEIIEMMSPGVEPTKEDLQNLDDLNEGVQAYARAVAESREYDLQ